MRRPSRFGKTLAALAFALFAAACALVVHGRRAKPRGTYDAIVVAGCRVRANGRPSAALRGRVLRAVALYRRGLAPRIVTTGGREQNGFVEADVAALEAMDAGLDPDRIVRERASRSTEENAKLAARLVGRHARVLVVTDDYHVFRARRVFARHFDAADATGVGAPVRARSVGLVRELWAVTIYAAIGRL